MQHYVGLDVSVVTFPCALVAPLLRGFFFTNR